MTYSSLFSRSASMFALAALVCAAGADTVLYNANPSAYDAVTRSLDAEFGTASFPPLVEADATTYRVAGTNAVDLTFGFRGDTGGFQFNFGFYRITPELQAMNLLDASGRAAYARAALASDNATLVFDDAGDDPDAAGGTTRTFGVEGGSSLGFFLIPNGSLTSFQDDPDSVEPTPLFSVAEANPGGLDQLMSFSGLSRITGSEVNLFAWEDLARATGTDDNFDDLVFTVNGIQATPEPTTMAAMGLGVLAALRRRRK